MSSEKNWFLTLSYKGTRYHGWQIQPTVNTIEAELENALEVLHKYHVPVLGAGRTDAGVHALNQTANFHSTLEFTKERWQKSLNGILPNDIVIKCIEERPLDFHARHSSVGKKYRYLIQNTSHRSPLANDLSWWIPQPLDLESMRTGAVSLLGEHDFSAFRASNCDSPHPVKHLYAVTISSIDSLVSNLQIDIYANSFLKNMVRIIVGTLVEVGLHRKPAETLSTILASHDRTQAGVTAPAHGLYALEVLY